MSDHSDQVTKKYVDDGLPPTRQEFDELKREVERLKTALSERQNRVFKMNADFDELKAENEKNKRILEVVEHSRDVALDAFESMEKRIAELKAKLDIATEALLIITITPSRDDASYRASEALKKIRGDE